MAFTHFSFSEATEPHRRVIRGSAHVVFAKAVVAVSTLRESSDLEPAVGRGHGATSANITTRIRPSKAAVRHLLSTPHDDAIATCIDTLCEATACAKLRPAQTTAQGKCALCATPHLMMSAAAARATAHYASIVPSVTTTAGPPTLAATSAPPRMVIPSSIRLGRPISKPCSMTKWCSPSPSRIA